MALTINTQGYTSFFTYVLSNMFSGVTTPKFKVYDGDIALIATVTSTGTSFKHTMSGSDIISINYDPTINSIPLLFTIPPSTAIIKELRLFTTTSPRSAMGELEFARWTFTTGTEPEFTDGGTLSFSQYILDLGVE